MDIISDLRKKGGSSGSVEKKKKTRYGKLLRNFV
jgi:hypothetical protein